MGCRKDQEAVQSWPGAASFNHLKCRSLFYGVIFFRSRGCLVLFKGKWFCNSQAQRVLASKSVRSLVSYNQLWYSRLKNGYAHALLI